MQSRRPTNPFGFFTPLELSILKTLADPFRSSCNPGSLARCRESISAFAPATRNPDEAYGE